MAEAVRRGHLPRLPDRVQNAPQLREGLELYWTAYVELTTCRPAAFGGCPPLPWTAMATWAQFHSLDYDQFEDLIYFSREMDAEYEKWWNRQQPNGGGKLGAKQEK